MSITLTSPMKISTTQPTSLLPKRLFHQEGGTKPDWSGSQLLISAPCQLDWKIDVVQEDDYEIAICYSAPASGCTLELLCEDRIIAQAMSSTDGYFPSASANMERAYLTSSLKLDRGIHTLSLRFKDLAGMDQIVFGALDIIPPGLKETWLEKSPETAGNATSDWFQNAGYGLMLHWTSMSQPRYGQKKNYQDAVQDFDVEVFADMVEMTGASYILFTVNHAEPSCPAPIQSWEKLHPGWTTERDLIAEIGNALKQRGIKLLLYIHSPTMANVHFIEHLQLNQVEWEEYVANHEAILTEIGERYGTLVAGYWFDCWYQTLEQYGAVPLERIYKATKAGNPERLASFNYWMFPVGSLQQDYWAGEVYNLIKPANGRIMKNGLGKDLPYHVIVVLDTPEWVHSDIEQEIAPIRFDRDELAEFIKTCKANEGVVSINLGIYQDGRLGEQTLKFMQEIKRLVYNEA